MPASDPRRGLAALLPMLEACPDAALPSVPGPHFVEIVAGILVGILNASAENFNILLGSAEFVRLLQITRLRTTSSDCVLFRMLEGYLNQKGLLNPDMEPANTLSIDDVLRLTIIFKKCRSFPGMSDVTQLPQDIVWAQRLVRCVVTKRSSHQFQACFDFSSQLVSYLPSHPDRYYSAQLMSEFLFVLYSPFVELMYSMLASGQRDRIVKPPEISSRDTKLLSIYLAYLMGQNRFPYARIPPWLATPHGFQSYTRGLSQVDRADIPLTFPIECVMQ